ncbi:MAG: aminotransferase class IV [Bacteroidales bacterium]|jgi:branched-chain amino acid aminotransferase|nr:aminotransferase class IV [Bacteroidales bacterium]
MNRFVIFNGKVVEKNEVNLSFLFWEEQIAISQKCWFGYGGIPLFDENVNLLIQQIEILKFPCPEFLNDKNELFRVVKRMLNKNKFYRSGYIYFYIFRQENKLNTLVLSKLHEKFDFPLTERGILVNFSNIIKLSINEYYRYSFYNETFWKVVEARNKGTYFQNSLILNENQSVCEAIYANLYVITGKTFFTPSLMTGSYEDTLREIIIDIARDIGFVISETENLKKKDIFDADEVFIAGETIGINWILGIENKRFVHKYSEEIHQKLNSYLKGKANR